MRWTLAFVVALSVGCGGTPVGPTTTPPAASPGSTTLTISGRVIEPDGNTPVEGASVCWSPSGEPRCTTTLSDGTYSLVTDRPAFPPTAQSIRLAPAVS